MDRLIKNVVSNRLLWKAGELFHVDDRFIEPHLNELLESVKHIIISPGYEITVNDQNVAEICLARSIVAIRSSKERHKYEEKLVDIMKCCLKFPLCSFNGLIPPHAKIASDILSYFYLNYPGLPTTTGFLETSTKFLLCGNSGIMENLTNFFLLVVENNVCFFASYVDVVLQSILHHDNLSLIPMLVHLHGVDDTKLMPRNLNQLLLTSAKNGDDGVRESALRLVSLIYEDDPQVVEECLRRIIDFLNYPPSVRTTINILNVVFWTNQQIFYYHVTGLMQIGLAASTEDFDLIGSLLVSICSTDEVLAKDCLVYLSACLFHKTSNVAIIFAWIESLLQKYQCHLQVMRDVVSHLENEDETTEFSVNAIARLKQIVDESAHRNSAAFEATLPKQELWESVLTRNSIEESDNHLPVEAENFSHTSKVESDPSFAETRRLLRHQVCDKASNTDVILPQEPISNNLSEGTNQVNVSAPDVKEDSCPINGEVVERSISDPPVNCALGDENHNYLNGSKTKTTESRTTEKVNLEEIEGTDSAKSETEFKTEENELDDGKVACTETDEKTKSSYFENIGFLSSQTSVNDDPVEGHTCISKTSTSDITRASRSAKNGPSLTSEDTLAEDKPSGSLNVSRTIRNSGTFLRGESVQTDSCKNGESRRESSKAYGGASLSTSMSLLESKSTLCPDSLEMYCDSHKQEVISFIRTLLAKSPIPSDVLVSSANKNQQKCFIEFCCPSQEPRCAFRSNSGFRLETKHIRSWLHVMYLRDGVETNSRCHDNSESLQGDYQILGNESTTTSSHLASCCSKHQQQMKMKNKIRLAWSSIHSLEKKSFIKTVLSGFPHEKEINKALKELKESRCFDLFSRSEGSEDWLCFVCRNKTHSPSFLRSDGSLNVNGVLKKKSGYLKLFKPWRFTRFLIDGFNLSYMTNDQPVHLEEITKVKAKEHSMLLTKYTTVSLTAVKAANSSHCSGHAPGDGNRLKKKRLTLRFFDQNEAKTWIRCLYMVMMKFQNVSDNLGMNLLSE